MRPMVPRKCRDASYNSTRCDGGEHVPHTLGRFSLKRHFKFPDRAVAGAPLVEAKACEPLLGLGKQRGV